MTFFHDLNKRLAALAAKTEQEQIAESKKAETVAKSPLTQALNESAVAKAGYSAKAARAGKDIGKPGKNFAKIAKGAAERYGSKAAGERVAGAVLNKLRHPKEDIENEGNAFTGALAKTPKGGKFKVGGKQFTDTSSIEEGTCPGCGCSPCECVEESALQGYLGKKKYGPEGMKALQKAGREHVGKAKMDQIRNRYDKMDEEMADEGNAFTAALAKTPKGGKFKVGGKEFSDTSDLEEGFAEMDAWLASREKEKGTGKFDVKDTGYSKRYTRKHEDDEADTDDEVKNDEPKRRGRPKSAKSKDSERVTSRSHKYKTVDGKRVKKEKTKEDIDTDGVMMTRPSNMSSESMDHNEYDAEGDMAKGDMHTIMRHARELETHLRDNDNLPTWVIEKLGQIKGMMTSVSDYIISEKERGIEKATGREGITIEPVAEKAVSQAQQRFMGMAHAMQKGKKIPGASAELKKVAKSMKPSDTHDFAATKHKGLPKHVEEESTDKEDQRAERAGRKVAKDIEHDEGHKGKDDNRAEKAGKKVTKDIEYDDKKDRKEKEEKVDETTVAGSVATATTSGKSSKGGMQFGKGVYESLDKQFKQALTESIHIESKMEECGDGEMAPAITITADGEEAAKLMMLLKLAGLESQIPKACPTCGASPCGCDEMVDENAPDWPTNTEKLAAEPNLRTYSGGLNGPKSTGQTTVPVVASQLRRQASMEESVELERTLFKTWKNYKG